MIDCFATKYAMIDLTRPHPVRSFLAQFEPDFARRDQIRWAEAYVRGLLADPPRKNVETIARHLVLPATWKVEDPKQALQNFINQSPWDEGKVWQRYRTLVARQLGRPDGVFVVCEVPFLKQGRHSIGVQRQFSPTLGQKTNCQVAVGIHYVSSAGQAPLALRLYLPGNWVRSPEQLQSARVPLEFRRKVTKSDIALSLLEGLFAEGFPGCQVTVGAVTSFQELTVELIQRGLWHEDGRAAGVADKWFAEMKKSLGLDHFEGRSWRGFHHHACLVMLAFACSTFKHFSGSGFTERSTI